MYRSDGVIPENQTFEFPTGFSLRPDNRWVILALIIPWDEFEIIYIQSLADSGMGAPAIPARVVIGALIIQTILDLTDRELVEQIRENPYLQFFIGIEVFRHEAPFNPSSLVNFRKRLNADLLSAINEIVIRHGKESADQAAKNEDTESGVTASGYPAPAESEQTPTEEDEAGTPDGQETENKGKLLTDATCVPADIRHPNDLSILNEAREKSEEIIDAMHEPLVGEVKKPRTYRKRARKEFLRAAKKKKLSRKQRRKAIRKQLGYLRRNLETINETADLYGLETLTPRQYRNLLVITEVLRQQQEMYDNDVHRINDRIVSISQPHVRPIKRGKAGADTEFGAKITISVVDGYTYVETISWDNFNESTFLTDQIERYRASFGFYPESVHADQIYRTRKNLSYCRQRGIRFTGQPLAKAQTDEGDETKEQRETAAQDAIDRIPVEGKFGQAKRRFGLNRIMTKLPETSECVIILTFLVMNLRKWLDAVIARRDVRASFLKVIFLAITGLIRRLTVQKADFRAFLKELSFDIHLAQSQFFRFAARF